MKSTGLKLTLVATLIVAVLVGGAAVVFGAGTQKPSGDAFSAPMASGGPAGRLALSGPWVESDDPADVGVESGWASGQFTGRLVDIPYVPNAAHVTGAAGVAAYRGGIAWYRTTLTAPRTGSYALRFESVHHIATVWLDGREIATHTGAYLPFEVGLRLREGVAHTLVVRADFRCPTCQKRAGWHRTWFNYGGINREVTLRPLARSEVEAPAVRTRLYRGAAIVDVSTTVDNRASSTRSLQARGTLGRRGSATAFAFPRVRIAPHESKRVTTRVVIKNPHLWQPGAPNLYALHVGVAGEGSWDDSVGLREVTRSGRELLLNGRRLRLHGASINEDADGHGDGLTAADMDRVVRELKAIGANATRAQHALSPPLLERLDRAGILVWQGVGPVDAPGAWTSGTPELAHAARERVRTSVRQEQLHPSVIAWNLANEIAGNGHDASQVAYISDMARELHREDPGRIVAVDLWGAHPPRVPGEIYKNVDAVALTNYIGWYEGADESRAQIASRLHSTALGFTRLFPKKVLLVSEFGAEANAANAAEAPGGYAYQSWLLRRHIATYRALPQLSGMLVWNLQDFGVAPTFAGGSIRSVIPAIVVERGLNTKGLFTYNGTAKPAAAAVARAFAALPGG
ncbi:glycoside hydrolase family 2 protein [Conexibacter woesei]|uniref:glycoside hydrolase family 2 protein n=1 Tax=Conexibacter woesei TaxID=191495 RepID=UPI0004247623|nr:glycoside hydrolase family 2 [Conexibacter woesei]